MIDRIWQKYRKTGFCGLLNAIAHRLLRRSKPPFDPIPAALETVFADGDFTIIQIGAFIGDTPNDPLFRTLKKELKKGRGRLICVEPVKEHFDSLVRNYGDTPNVICENVAIADHCGQSAFYRLRIDPVEHGYPAWLSQLGSLKKERMESLWDKHERNEQIKAFYLQHRVKEMVPCITFAELLRQHDIKSVDLLQMDTEGYELEILSTIDFSSIPIRFVNYECVLLHEHKNDAEQLMRDKGYRTIDHDLDTFCYRPNDERLTARCGELIRHG